MYVVLLRYFYVVNHFNPSEWALFQNVKSNTVHQLKITRVPIRKYGVIWTSCWRPWTNPMQIVDVFMLQFMSRTSKSKKGMISCLHQKPYRSTLFCTLQISRVGTQGGDMGHEPPKYYCWVYFVIVPIIYVIFIHF